MNMKDKIEELEKRVRELEARPVFVPMPYYQPIFYPPNPYLPPVQPFWNQPWCAPYVTTCNVPATTGGQMMLT